MTKRVSKLPNRTWAVDKKLRACAYVRVSTGYDKQLDSLENQTEYYRNKLTDSPLYTFSGIYSDAGISGAKKNRPGFEAMMEAARSGEIDIIYTKSLSRFARNAVFLLNTVRELKELGVRVIFEKEKPGHDKRPGRIGVDNSGYR